MVIVQWFTLAASACFLGLAVIAATRAQRNSLALPLALLCADLFAYNAFDVLGSLMGHRQWEWLESATAALAAPLMLHFALVFVGALRANRWILIASYAWFGMLVLGCVAPFAIKTMQWFPSGDLWAQLMLVGVVPSFGWAAWLLVRHYRSNVDPDERARTQLYVGTFAMGVGGPAMDLAYIARSSIAPSFGAPAMLASALLLAALTFRIRMMRGATMLLMANAIVIGVVGTAAMFLLDTWAGERTALLLIGTIAILLAVLAAARAVYVSFAAYRERAAYLATLGRLSAQMAHDLRNPLAAIRGAAQFLEEERKRGRSIDDQSSFLELIVEQTERLERVVRDYQRLGRAEPLRTPVDAGGLVRKVAESMQASPVAREKQISIEADPASGLPLCSLDEDLVTAALENLVRNSIEAMTSGGKIALRAELERGHGGVAITVSDDGPGMDARTRERATEAFFTTKAEGTGLGLAFVRRVTEAHGGRMRIDSALGKGTRIRLAFPTERESRV